MEREALKNQIKTKYEISDFVARGGHGALSLSAIETYIQQYQALYNGATATIKDQLIKQGLSPEAVTKIMSGEISTTHKPTYDKNVELIEKWKDVLAKSKGEDTEKARQAIQELEAANQDLQMKSILSNPDSLKALLGSEDAAFASSVEQHSKKEKLLNSRSTALKEFFISKRKTEQEAQEIVEWELTPLEVIEIFQSIAEEPENGFKEGAADFFMSMRSTES